MITTIFSKSQPVNFIFIAVLLTFGFALFQIQNENLISAEILASKLLIFLLLAFDILLANFIGNKNNLQKNSAFSVSFHVMFVLLIPDVFNDLNLLVANTLVLFAIRRLLSMQSQIDVKQKIFDASMLIFTAALFKFWAVLFTLLVFASILFYAARDYRNWIIPYIAIVATTIAFIFFSLIVDPMLINTFWKSRFISLNFDYFSNSFQNLSISFYTSIAVLFIANLITIYSRKSLTSHPHYKILLLTFIIGLTFYILTPNKSNGLLIFTLAPLSILAANFFDNCETEWIKETTAVFIILFSLICFFGQIY